MWLVIVGDHITSLHAGVTLLMYVAGHRRR